MEKSGEKAGERAGKAASKAMKDEVAKSGIDKELEKQIQSGVSNIEKALGDINTRNLGKKLRSEVAAMQSELDALSKTDLKVDDNVAVVAAKVRALTAQIENMRTRSKVFFDIKGLPDVYRSITQVQKAIDSIDGDVELDVDTRTLDRKMGAFEKKFKKTAAKAADHLSGSMNKEIQKVVTELKYLENLRIGIDISGNRARAELKEIAADIERITSGSNDIDLKTDAAGAFAQLKAFDAALDKIDGKDVRVDVKVDVDNKGLNRAKVSGDDAANSFRSFNLILLATASIGPALIPVLAGIAGGLLAIGPAAAVAGFGLGAVLVGFSGLGDAIGALQAQQDSAATNAVSNAAKQKSANYAIRDAIEALQDAQRNAARAAEDAAERVADARRMAARAAEDAAEAVSDAREAAADALEDAIEREKDAREEYVDAVNAVAEAEQNLRDAREAAQKKADTIAKRQRQNAVDERQAVLDLGEAQNNFNAVMADGSSTNTDKEQASVDLEQAQIALNDTRDEQVALADEAADYAKNGVEGTEGVQSAQEALTEAIEAQAEAQAAVAEAAAESDKVRKEGAEDVAEALRDQNEVLSDNARAIAQALEDQRETHSDNARAIADAREALRRAREAGVADLEQIDSAAQAVKTAFDKLGPAGATFALFLFSLREGFRRFRDDVQQAMLPAVQQAIEGFLGSSNATKSRKMLVELARAFGDFTKALSVSFQGPAWAAFFEMMATTGVKIMDAWGGAFIKIMEAFASILTTSAPFALRFAEGLEKMMDGFAKWAASKEGADDLRDFIAYVKEIGPAVLDFFGSLASALGALAVALAPYGGAVLDSLTAVFDYIASMDKDVLGALATGLTVLILASQVAYLVMNVMMAGAALFASTVGVWVFAIVGIGIALIYLYNQNEKFRDFIDDAWVKIREAFTKAWYDHIKPALMELWDAIKVLWKDVLEPFIEWAAPKLLWLAEHVIPLFARFFAAQIKAVAWVITEILVPAFKKIGEWWMFVSAGIKRAWEQVLQPVFKAVWEGIKFLWQKVVKPVLGFIWNAFKTAFGLIKLNWNKVLWPILDLFITVIWNLWKLTVKPVLKFIWEQFQKVGTIFGQVWRDHIKPALENLRDFIGDDVLPMFTTHVNNIKAVWEGLKEAFASPVRFLIEKVINEGIVGGFNQIANLVGSTPMKPVSVPDWAAQSNTAKGQVPTGGGKTYATGGILPGYTPGRDPHVFQSPTAGTLALSGGEAIMRPEWTRAMGSGYVDSMNKIAASGGVDAIRRAMGFAKGGIVQAFAKGGIVFPVPGGYVTRSPYNLGHDGMDINHPNDSSGNVPFYSATSGRVTTTGYSRGYGNAIFVASPYGELVYGHSADGTARVKPGQKVAPGTPLANIGNTGNSEGSHLHFGFPGGTFYGAEALLAGSAMPNAADIAAATGPKNLVPDWAKAIITKPLNWAKDLVSKPIEAMKDKFGGGAYVGLLADTGMTLAKAVGEKVANYIPGKKAFNAAGEAVGKAVDGLSSLATGASDALGFADGGILPYNGAMMYDNGGYLPPGLTTVMNLTGKPEPVFTADQFDGMGAGGEGFTYAPTFAGSNLTAADVVDDLDFTRRKIRREGKYGRSKL